MRLIEFLLKEPYNESLSIILIIAFFNSSGLFGSIRYPFFPLLIASGIPPTFVPITGLPQALASKM